MLCCLRFGVGVNCRVEHGRRRWSQTGGDQIVRGGPGPRPNRQGGKSSDFQQFVSKFFVGLGGVKIRNGEEIIAGINLMSMGITMEDGVFRNC